MYSTELARVLSKLGFCSRAQARALVQAGRVRVDGRTVRDPDVAVKAKTLIEVDGRRVGESGKVYVMLNKPRGLITSTSDEKGRDTVYKCFEGATLPRLVAVGRLDQASEGLLLCTNDNDWAAQITSPESKVLKTYHVQIDRILEESAMAAIKAGQQFRVRDAKTLRAGQRNSWIEIVLDEGKNRHIRRLLDALEIQVLRLIRIGIGNLALGDLPKGKWRHLTADEQRRIFTG